MICRGKLILMADADGATKFSDIEKVEAALCDLSPKPVWKWVFFGGGGVSSLSCVI